MDITVKIVWLLDGIQNAGIDDKGKVWKLSPIREIATKTHMGYPDYYRINRSWYSKRKLNELSIELSNPKEYTIKKVPFKLKSKCK